MDFIADVLLAAGALGAGLYCFILGRRLNRFNNLEKGVGGAVAVLSAQVDDLTKTLAAAQNTAAVSTDTLVKLTERAEQTSHQLELQMASLHDIPKTHQNDPPPKKQPPPQAEPPLTSGEPMFMRRTIGAK